MTKKCGENYVKNIKHIIKDLILKKYQENSEGEDKNGMSVYEEINKILCIKPDEDRRETPADALISRFPLLGITSAFKKFQTHEPLLPYEEAAIIQFANKYTTSWPGSTNGGWVEIGLPCITSQTGGPLKKDNTNNPQWSNNMGYLKENYSFEIL